eukprot:m.334014 g.334014  ORF g.334014 m.334014 type:complete len:636 (+) comp17269_c0_seq1:327-2234(+)
MVVRGTDEFEGVQMMMADDHQDVPPSPTSSDAVLTRGGSINYQHGSPPNFWEKDQYSEVLRRMSEGNIACENMSKMLTERASIEKKYAKELKKWADKWSQQNTKFYEYGGSLSVGIHLTVSTAHKMAEQHFQMQRVQETQAGAIDHFCKHVYQSEAKIRQANKVFRAAQMPWDKRKQAVMKASQVHNGKAQRNSRSRGSRKQNSISKLKYKLDQAIQSLMEYRPVYEEQMKQQFDQLQNSEKDRIQLLKRALLENHRVTDIPTIFGAEMKKVGTMMTSISPEGDVAYFSQKFGAGQPLYLPDSDGRFTISVAMGETPPVTTKKQQNLIPQAYALYSAPSSSSLNKSGNADANSTSSGSQLSLVSPLQDEQQQPKRRITIVSSLPPKHPLNHPPHITIASASSAPISQHNSLNQKRNSMPSLPSEAYMKPNNMSNKDKRVTVMGEMRYKMNENGELVMAPVPTKAQHRQRLNTTTSIEDDDYESDSSSDFPMPPMPPTPPDEEDFIPPAPRDSELPWTPTSGYRGATPLNDSMESVPKEGTKKRRTSRRTMSLGSVDTLQIQFVSKDDVGSKIVAIYDYDPTQPDELAIKAGDKLTIVQWEGEFEEEWVRVKNSRKEVGIVPITYVEYSEKIETKA